MKHLVPGIARLLLISVALGTLVKGAQKPAAAPAQISKEITKHLLSLPYYGVFDLLTFQIDAQGSVTLGGYVLNDTLKKDSEREVREVNGVTEVQNRIAIAPNLPLDDEIRHGVYHAIYGDSSLSRYGTSGSELWSMRPGFRGWGAGFGGRGFGGPGLMGAPFFGYDPVGNYAIHILVNNRIVTLAGVVDSDSDRTIAGLKARGVANVSQVDNSLQVATKS